MILFIRTQVNNVMLEPTIETSSALAGHYLPVAPTVPYIGPSKVTLVTIQFEFTTDLPIALRKWEQLGFVRVNPCGDTPLADNVDRSGFPFEAAAIGASIVVSTAWPAPPQAVYLAPASSQAREAGRTVRSYGSTTFELSAPLPVATSHLQPETCEAARILLDETRDDLQATVGKWEKAGFVRLGTADAVIRNDLMGYWHIIAYTAFAVGATLIIFQGTPAKLRKIRRLDDGHIDMDAVYADPPVQLSPRGSSVIQAVFLAPTSIEARATAEAALTCIHVPTNPCADQTG
jgi:hypothetical protein